MRWKLIAAATLALAVLVAVPTMPGCDALGLDGGAAATKVINETEQRIRAMDEKLAALQEQAQAQAQSVERDKALSVLADGRALMAEGLEATKAARALAAQLSPVATGPPGDWTWWGLGIWAAGATLRAIQNRAAGRNIASSLQRANGILNAGDRVGETMSADGPLGMLAKVIKASGLQSATASRVVDEAQGRAMKLPL